MTDREQLCACTVCDNMLYKGDLLADHKKYESDGSGIDYIELAHQSCGIKDNIQSGTEYWEYDVPPPPKVWDKASIVDLLRTNDKAVGRALLVLLARQTADEQAAQITHYHNGQGFTGFDAQPMTSMAKFFKARGYLTVKQLAWLRKTDKHGNMKIGKYHAQLLEAIQQKTEQMNHSISYDEVDDGCSSHV